MTGNIKNTPNTSEDVDNHINDNAVMMNTKRNGGKKINKNNHGEEKTHARTHAHTSMVKFE